MSEASPGLPYRVITAEDVERWVTLDVAYRSQADVFTAFARGEAAMGPRALLDVGSSTAFCYLARASADGPAVVKVGSVTPENAGTDRPVVRAQILVLDRTTGAIGLMVDGESVTRLRTAAASAVAVDALAGAVERVVVVGAGLQGQAHARALAACHPDAGSTVLGRGADLESQVRHADIVALCTSSHTPVLDAAWLRPGATVVSIGAFAPDRHEFGSDLLDRAGTVVVDDPATAARQCGPIASAVAGGSLSVSSLVALGDVLDGAVPGRRSPDDVVVYASVGLGIQDAAVVEVLQRSGAA